VVSPPCILAFAGSARTDSFNKRLLPIAVQGARQAGVDVTVIDLRDFPLPIYDGDCEATQGLPPNALRLKELFAQHRGLLIAAPEYNSSITPLLKNTIDWVSRTAPGEAALASITGRTAALISASPGALGGLRGLRHVREILGNIGVLVLPDQVAVPKANEAFQPDGSLKDARQQSAVSGVGEKLARLLIKLSD
jgi:chromate reductase, NAD(P)H dehydrogenase (quinone)